MGLRRRETTAIKRAEAELRDRETRRAELASEIERAELDVAEKHAAVQAADGAELAAYAARGDRGDAKRRREDTERELEAARAELDRLRRYQAGLERYVEEARAAVRAAQRDDAEARYGDALDERNEAVAAFPPAATRDDRGRDRPPRARAAEHGLLDALADRPDRLGSGRRTRPSRRQGRPRLGARKQFIEERRAMERAARESLETRGAQRDHKTVEAEYNRLGRPEPLEDRVRALLDETVAA